MAYILNFSDPTKITAITVPDMPPGINTVDTSLSFVGKGYPNYGQVFDQNLLKLLENFASPLPPTNPIEGQLWYDTSNAANKVLRIMNGSSGNVSWPTANGIYQQAGDPSLSYAMKPGDIWVDTANNQLNLYGSGAWIPVSNSQEGSLNGPINTTLTDTQGNNHFATLIYVAGTIVSIITLESFTPNPIISGFSTLFAGINVFGSGILSGTSLASGNLIVGKVAVPATSFLRKDDSTLNGQVITGRIAFTTPNTNGNQSGSQGRDGVVINVVGQDSSNYTQLYKYGANSVLLNNQVGGNILFQTVTSLGAVPNNTLSIADGMVAINTSTNSISLDVYGTARISNTLSVGSTLTVSGDTSLNGMLTVVNTSTLANDVVVQGQIFIDWVDGNGMPLSGSGILPMTTGIYDIGSSSQYFNHVYASSVGTTGTQHFGIFNGPATGLTYASTFKMAGQVTATNFTFQGTGTTATFNTTLTASAITAQQTATYTTSTMNLLAVDTSPTASYTGLQQISASTLFTGLFVPGLIMAYGSKIPPTGWLLCDGTYYFASDYPALAAALEYGGTGNYIYGGNVVTGFAVPDLRVATVVVKAAGTEPTNYVNYIIKT